MVRKRQEEKSTRARTPMRITYDVAPAAEAVRRQPAVRREQALVAQALIEGRRLYVSEGKVVRLKPEPANRENLLILRLRVRQVARRLGMKVRTYITERDDLIVVPLTDPQHLPVDLVGSDVDVPVSAGYN